MKNGSKKRSHLKYLFRHFPGLLWSQVGIESNLWRRNRRQSHEARAAHRPGAAGSGAPSAADIPPQGTSRPTAARTLWGPQPRSKRFAGYHHPAQEWVPEAFRSKLAPSRKGNYTHSKFLCSKDSRPKETFKIRQFYRNLSILFCIVTIPFSKCAVFSIFFQNIVLK